MLEIKLPIYYKPIEIAEDHKQLKKDFITLCLQILKRTDYTSEGNKLLFSLTRKLNTINEAIKKDVYVKLTVNTEELEYVRSLKGNDLATYFKQREVYAGINFFQSFSIMAWFSELKDIQDSEKEGKKVLLYKLKDNWFGIAPVNYWFIEALILYYKDESEYLINKAYKQLLIYNQCGYVFKHHKDEYFVKVNEMLTNFYLLQGFKKDEIPVWEPPEPSCKYCVYHKKGKCSKHITENGFLKVALNDVCPDFIAD